MRYVRLMLCGSLLTTLPQPAFAQAPATLKEAFEGAFLLGTSISGNIPSGRDTASLRLVTEHFNTITAENVLKAGSINPQPGVYIFEPAAADVEYGERNSMFIVGHTLVCHNQTPARFCQDQAGNPNTPAAQLERLRSHIETVAGRYAGRN